MSVRRAFTATLLNALLLLHSPDVHAATSPAPPASARSRATTSAPTRASTATKGATSAVATAEPRIFLSWNAPYGSRRAAESIMAPCGDTTQVDTLYLSFESGRTAPQIVGVSATLYFHAAEGAALGAIWKLPRHTLGGTPLQVSFESDSARGFITPWRSQGAGAPYYDYVTTSGRLRMLYAVALGAGPGLRGNQRYGFARVMVRRSAAGGGGCGDPMCVEWHVATLAFGQRDEVSANQGPRWVSMNSPGGEVCTAARAIVGAQPWKPKGTKP